MTVRKLACALAVVLVPAAAARADTTDTLLTIGFVGTLGVSGITTAVNGTYLAYDEAAARGWKLVGMAAGGIDVAAAAALFITQNDKTSGLVLGGLALGVGAATLATAILVKEDTVQVGVQPVAGGGAALLLGGRF